MFKNFLQYYNKTIQLVILLSIWMALLLIGVYIQTLYIQYAAHINPDQLVDFLAEDIYKQPQLIFLSNTLFQLLAFLVPGLLFAYLAHPRPLAYLGLQAAPKPVQAIWVVLLGAGVMVFIGILGGWMQQLDFGSAAKAMDEQRKRMVELYMQSGSAWSVLRNLLLIALLPAVCEEVFFRGILQKFAYSFTRKWWLSILLAALVFTLFHSSVAEFLPILLAGIVLGLVYYLSGNLWLSILLHFVHNGMQVVIAYINKGAMDKVEEQTGMAITYFAMAAVVTAFSLLKLYKHRTTLPNDWNVELKEEREAGVT